MRKTSAGASQKNPTFRLWVPNSASLSKESHKICFHIHLPCRNSYLSFFFNPTAGDLCSGFSAFQNKYVHFFSAKKLSVRPFSPTYPILACGLAGRIRPPSPSNTFQILLEEPKPLPGRPGYVFISSGLCLTGSPDRRAPWCPSYTQPPPSGSTFAWKDMGVG